MNKIVDKDLVQYVEQDIIPKYLGFDAAHQVNHVNTVIAESMSIAEHYDVNIDMVYCIAAYHDLGLVQGRELHHIDSGKIMESDDKLRDWFSHEQILTMKEAVEDHRASSDHEPRSIYGKIVAEADRIIGSYITFKRTVQYGLLHYPSLDKEGHYRRTVEHMNEKYVSGGYLKLWFPESKNTVQLAEFRRLIANKVEFRKSFDAIYDELTK